MSTDAELVAGAIAGNRRAFGHIYGRYADRLFDFCMSVLRDRHAAEHAVHDTFLLAAQRLGRLNDPSRLRPLLYATARDVLLRKPKARPRPMGAAPHDLVWEAAAQLSTRDRLVLDLYLRQGFDGPELGEVLGIRAAKAHELLTRVREHAERTLGAFLVTRGQNECAALNTLLSGWDGTFSPSLHKRAARHIDHCGMCDWRRQSLPNPLARLAAIPLTTVPAPLRRRIMDHLELVPRPRPTTSIRSIRIPLAAAAATLLLTLAFGLIWGRHNPTTGDPTALDRNAVPTAPTRPAHPSTITPTSPPTSAATTTPPPRNSEPPTTSATTTPADPPVNPPQNQPTTTTTTTAALLPPANPTTTTPPPRDTTRPSIVSQSRADAQLLAAPCTPNQTQIHVNATDNVAVVSATLHWTAPTGTSGTTTMTLQNGQWQAPFGPFPRGTATWHVVIADAAGNIATGQTDNVTIARCRH